MVKLDNGKYEIKREGNRLVALRYGEPWRDLTGDNLIYWLVTEAENMIEARCDCGELLARYHKEAQGTMILRCPECKEFNQYQSTVSWEEVAEKLQVEDEDATI